MKIALDEAKNSGLDIPVGAVITRNSEIIAIAHNQKEITNDVTSHAEILALRKASKKLNNWRLDDCEMYVTLEPCPMCGWAILQSRIKTLYFGAYDNVYGAFSSGINLQSLANSNIKIYGGILENDCNKILDNFFSDIRN